MIGNIAKPVGACLCAMAISGCITMKPPSVDVATPAATPTPSKEGIILTRIAEPSLPKGDCGMVLWTAEGERALPIFRYVSEKNGEINIGNVQVKLTRTSFTGTSGFGVFERQEFTSEAGAVVTIVVNFGLGFDGGVYLERGLLTIETAEGWRTVVPAAGLAGCR